MPPLHPAQGSPPLHPPLSAAEIGLVDSLASMADPALVTRADLERPGPTIIGVSPALSVLTGYSPAELVGRSPRMLQGPLTDRGVLTKLRQACEQGARFLDQSVNYRKDGSSYMVQWTIDPVRSADGRITHFFSLQRDVTHAHQFAPEWLAAESRAQRAFAQVSAQAALIAEAILVLEKTKRSFRSKELAALRERLESATRSLRLPDSQPGGGKATH
ncbi:MAG TPA: PAS domain-containing protein [Opitutus sp.]|nr:PAS domain-containing protein [Opitutus sp.]